jgi:hypothetical protein
MASAQGAERAGGTRFAILNALKIQGGTLIIDEGFQKHLKD